jgi:hypothetical protein
MHDEKIEYNYLIWRNIKKLSSGILTSDTLRVFERYPVRIAETIGFQKLSRDDRDSVFLQAENYVWNEENNPWGDYDMVIAWVDSEKIFGKIETYPIDGEDDEKIITFMLASEY